MKGSNLLVGAMASVLALTLLVVLLIVPGGENDCVPPGGHSSRGGGPVEPGTKVFPVSTDQVVTSSGFGSRDGAFHWGLDFAGTRGTAVYAVYGGVVVAAKDRGVGGFGGWVVLEHTINGKTIQTTYGHMYPDQIHVAVGSTVHAGDHIADIGSAGESSGPHLHFEILPGDWRLTPKGSQGSIDPAAWLSDAVQPGDQSVPSTADVAQLVGATSMSSPAPAHDRAAASSEDVLVIGDDVAAAARLTLQQDMPGIRVDAETGRTFQEGARIIREQLGSLPPTVVLALGTINGVDATAFGELVEQIRQKNPSTRILAVTTWVDRPWTQTTNSAITGARGVEMVDWHSAVTHDATLLEGDGLHPSRKGQATFAHLISSSVTGQGRKIKRAPSTTNSTCKTGTAPMGGGGDLDLSKVPPAFREPFKQASTLCPGYPMSLVAAETDNESGFQHPIEGPMTQWGTAKGPSQFIDATWAIWGKDWNNDGRVDVQDPADAIPSMTTMLCADRDHFVALQAEGKMEGNPEELAIAAYHAGRGAVIAARGIPDTTDYLSTTADYVRNTRRKAKDYELPPGATNGAEAAPDPAIYTYGGHAADYATNAAHVAHDLLGQPYVWGGGDLGGPTAGIAHPQNPGVPGLDCSGLTRLAVYRASGGAVELPRTAQAQKTQGRAIPLTDARAGDLVFGPGHVGIVIAPGRMIHAPTFGQDSEESPFQAGMTARRVVE